MKKPIKKVHEAVYEPIADLKTWRAMPTHSIRHIDPFLFLNHHGPQKYGPNNNGLPFGPHPHRGFETLTFVLDGDITHKDSVSGESVINKGGIQWMTAGRGLIHSEISSDEFKKNGGREEVIQLWLNLPSKLKMTDPNYIGLQEDKIEHIKINDLVTLHLVSGKFENTSGPVHSLTGLLTSTIDMEKEGVFNDNPENAREILLYIVNGKVNINGEEAEEHQLIEFSKEGEEIEIKALEKSLLIYCHGQPFNEPIVAQGPFVMNSQEEIFQAFNDYQNGKLGRTNL